MVLLLKLQMTSQGGIHDHVKSTLTSTPALAHTTCTFPWTVPLSVHSVVSILHQSLSGVLVELHSPKSPEERGAMAPHVQKSTAAHAVAVVGCVCLSPTLTQRLVSTVFPELNSAYTHS